MKNKLKKKPVIFGILALAVILVGVTFAYYYAEVTLPNRFQVMTYNVQVQENFPGGFGTKEVSFVNAENSGDNNVPVVLRFSYNEYWDAVGDENVLDPTTGNSTVTKTWTSAFTNDFTLGADGWYYYKKILDPQESVQVLQSVTAGTKTGTYHLDFNFEAIQADVDAVYDIWGKTITINGDNVIWP